MEEMGLELSLPYPAMDRWVRIGLLMALAALAIPLLVAIEWMLVGAIQRAALGDAIPLVLTGALLLFGAKLWDKSKSEREAPPAPAPEWMKRSGTCAISCPTIMPPME